MSASLDHFSRGLAKAFERRIKERTKQQAVQVQKVAADAVAIDVVTSDAIITTQQDHDELYRTTIIQKMIAHIKSKG
jgi:hypothetical protein